MSSRKRRKRLARQRRTRRIALVTTLAVLVAALAGLALWASMDRAPEVVMRAYPMDYEAQVRRCALRFGLQPAYIAGVILAESDFDPQAVSSANAQGLMQLLPATAEWIAGKLDEDYVEGCLFDPDTNLRYGSWYLGFLMRRYNGDMRCASSAYHAGQGNVDKWLQNPEYSPDGLTLAVIPYENTDTYVQRVLRYYEKYSELYAEAQAS